MSDKSSLGESGVPSQQSSPPPSPNTMLAVRAVRNRGFCRLGSHQLSQTVLDMVVSLARKRLMTRSLWMKAVVTIASGILTRSWDALLLLLWCFSSSLGVWFSLPCWFRLRDRPGVDCEGGCAFHHLGLRPLSAPFATWSLLTRHAE